MIEEVLVSEQPLQLFFKEAGIETGEAFLRAKEVVETLTCLFKTETPTRHGFR